MKTKQFQKSQYDTNYETKSPLRRLILLVTFTGIMLIASTYAWFSVQNNVTIGGLTGTVNVPQGLEISLNALDWSHEIDFSQFEDQTVLKTQYGTTEHNIIPTEMLPVSTTGKDGIGKTDITMYKGTNYGGAELEDVVADVIDAENNKYPGYYAIDLFLRNVSGKNAEAYETLQLNTESFVNVINDASGLQNTVRVGFALYNAEETIDILASQEEILEATEGAIIENVAIWEPNAYDHVDYVVKNNNEITWTNEDKLGYLSDQTTGKYKGTEKIPTYALKAEATAITGGNVLENIYDWSGTNSTYLDKQITLQTDHKAGYYIKGGVKNLLSVNTPETALYTNGATGEVVTFKIPKDEVCKVRMYIWLEGQDVDCINYASHGQGIELDIGLTKGEEEGSGQVVIYEITLDTETLDMAEGETTTLTATVNENVDEDLIWTSSEPTVATIELAEGTEMGTVASVNELGRMLASTNLGNKSTVKVTALKAGETTITAKNADGSKVKECKVTVEEPFIPDGAYMPSGFSEVSKATSKRGYTIQDSQKNQYVWVEVPRNETVYNDLTDDDTEDDLYGDGNYVDDKNEDLLAIKEEDMTVEKLTAEQITGIETELKEYTVTYRNKTAYIDEYPDDATVLAATGIENVEKYNAHKNAMLVSVFKNQGFYVGKYETGIADSEPDEIDDESIEARVESDKSHTNQTPVIQANAYPYNWVTNKQAQTLATSMESGDRTSSLMFGVQWDLVLKYLETKAIEKGANSETIVSELNSNSTSWGNYQNNTTTTVTNTSAKFAEETANEWKDGAYGKKTSSTRVVLSTGASNDFSKMGIYDLAGNVYEWTLEYTSMSGSPCAIRGGVFDDGGSYYPASSHAYNPTYYAHCDVGFRLSLW